MVQKKENRRIIHLVNLREKPQKGCEVEIKNKNVKSIDVLYPPTDIKPEWRISKKDKKIKIIF